MKVIYPSLALLLLISIFTSCKKDAASTSSKTTTTATLASTGTIAITTLASTSTSSKDTLYMVNCFSRHSKKDTVASNALPTAIGTYLTANYAGYTFAKA